MQIVQASWGRRYLIRVVHSRLSSAEQHQVLAFLQQLDLAPVRPSAAGFFDLNRGLLVSVRLIFFFHFPSFSSFYFSSSSTSKRSLRYFHYFSPYPFLTPFTCLDVRLLISLFILLTFPVGGYAKIFPIFDIFS